MNSRTNISHACDLVQNSYKLSPRVERKVWRKELFETEKMKRSLGKFHLKCKISNVYKYVLKQTISA